MHSGAEWLYANSNGLERNVIKAAAKYLGSELSNPLYYYPNFAIASLPIRQLPSAEDIWRRKNNEFELALSSGHTFSKNGLEKIGVPYGTRARLILLYIVHQTRITPPEEKCIFMGKSLSDFMQKNGIHVRGGNFGSIGPLRKQAARLARCRFEFIFPDKWNKEFQTDDFSLSGTQLWKTSDTNQWPEFITVSSEFKESVKKHAFPLDRSAISILKQNALAFDWYVFLSYRVRKTKNFNTPIFIPWNKVMEQMGCNYRRYADLKANTIRALKYVGAVYPNLSLLVTHRGITIDRPAPQTFPKRKSLIKDYQLSSPQSMLNDAQDLVFNKHSNADKDTPTNK
ncbi:replication protein RepA [Terasakiella pusilla]|uniref:replication protein RepA n=1 Tax=Terasakiella pusilla TaxID=64973 RepID=UPI003AA82EB1